jgi:hypothetical protein
VPPEDQLAGYSWPDELAPALAPEDQEWLRQTRTELARLSEQLPGEWVGRRNFGLAWERFADLFRFNRVQGPSLGLGYAVDPGLPFTSLLATARLGLTDHRPTGSLTLRWDGPEARVDLSAYHLVSEVEPWTDGGGIGNSLDAVFAAHDEADYYLATGVGLELISNRGWLRDVHWRLGWERQRSVSAVAGSAINDVLGGSGLFPPNPGIAEGDFLRLSVERSARPGPLRVRVGADGMRGSALSAGRVWARTGLSFRMLGRRVVLGVAGGTMAGDSLPQLRFRVGGPLTVRGYPYGYRQGESFWSARADVNLRSYGILMPVVFGDVGDVIPSHQPLVGVGGGLSILGGVLRFDIAKGLRPALPVRFDLSLRWPH